MTDAKRITDLAEGILQVATAAPPQITMAAMTYASATLLEMLEINGVLKAESSMQAIRDTFVKQIDAHLAFFASEKEPRQ